MIWLVGIRGGGSFEIWRGVGCLEVNGGRTLGGKETKDLGCLCDNRLTTMVSP
jgi:hypothetical protein